MKKKNTDVNILFHPLEKMVTVRAGTRILDAIHEANIQFGAQCGGKGLCGKCKIILQSGNCTEEIKEDGIHLTPDECSKVYHFACRTRIYSDGEITIPVESRIDRPQILLQGDRWKKCCDPVISSGQMEVIRTGGTELLGPSIRISGNYSRKPSFHPSVKTDIVNLKGPVTAIITSAGGEPEVIAIESDKATDMYGIAIDLGTTTIAGILTNLKTGEMIATASTLNSQITFGEELVTRIVIGKTKQGLSNLQSAALKSINEVISSLLASGCVNPDKVYDLCVGGNTVMCYLLMGRDPGPLEFTDAPVSRKSILFRAGEYGITSHPCACVYCLPAVSRFVGGDAVGDVITSGLIQTRDISLLIDLGTNGEIILGNSDWLVSTSCASGPAFEGSGLSSGIRGMHGAIDHVRIDPVTAMVSYDVIGDTKPRGICGSGIIDAVAAMAAAGILDFSGKLVPGAPGVGEGQGGLTYLLVPGEKTATGRDICITHQDMAYLMDTKAAILGAISVLFMKYKVKPADIKHLYLAGAFGSYSTIDQLISCGILPELPEAEIHRIGNGSLAGAYAALVSRDIRGEAEKIASMMGYIDLMVDTDFIDEYWSALRIPGKEELFPSFYSSRKPGGIRKS